MKSGTTIRETAATFKELAATEMKHGFENAKTEDVWSEKRVR
jgi:hypothetical protein